MSKIKVYHYLSKRKFKEIETRGIIVPSAPFNTKITQQEWNAYAKGFPFKIFPHYTCTFLEEEPERWKEYGLFELLMEEFASGEHLVSLTIEDNRELPMIVRDHKFHSPKEYGIPPTIWKTQEARNSRQDLRERWYKSTVLLREYKGDYICPEVLIPFNVKRTQIEVIR